MRTIIYFIVISTLIFSCSGDKLSYENRDGELFKIIRYPNDSIKSIVKIKNEKPFGTEKYFYKNGKLKKERDWYDGEIWGNQYCYFDNVDTVIRQDDQGPYLAVMSRLKSYKFNIKNQAVFEIDLDEHGHVDRYKGNFVIIVHPKLERFAIGDTLNLEIQFPAIYDLSVDLGLYEVLLDGKYKYLSTPELNNDQMRAYTTILLTDEGRKILAVIYEVKMEGLIVKDTSLLPSFTVR